MVRTDIPNLDFLPTGDTRGIPIEDAARRLAALAAGMIEQKTSGVPLDLARLGEPDERAPRPPQIRQKLVGT